MRMMSMRTMSRRRRGSEFLYHFEISDMSVAIQRARGQGGEVRAGPEEWSPRPGVLGEEGGIGRHPTSPQPPPRSLRTPCHYSRY